MREYKLNLKEYSISQYRYMELKAFCQQYAEKKSKLNEIYTLSSAGFDLSISSGSVSDPTQSKAIKAQRYRKDIAMIDRCLELASEGNPDIKKQLKSNVTQNMGYEKLGWMPCGRKQFFILRRKFFYYLDIELQKK